MISYVPAAKSFGRGCVLHVTLNCAVGAILLWIGRFEIHEE